VLQFLFRLIARLPLSSLHAMGAALGWLTYWGAPAYARRLRENLYASGVSRGLERDQCDQLLRQVVAETGKGALELIAIWFASDERIRGWLHCDSLQVIEQLRQSGKSVIVLTPHLGGFEIGAPCMAQKMPLTVMYRPPKIRWLEPLMIAGRSRFGTAVAPASMKGVRMLLRALHRGETVALVPDQTPGAGEGKWADYFGRPAYTMTLIAKLQQATGAALVTVGVERLPEGRGYHVRFEELPAENFDEAALNRALETLVRACPAQYLWGYNRYKVPEGTVAPDGK
jgi:KDO2-lipid IV(A) lauroyltransferase